MMSGFSTIRQDILNLPNILTLLRILVIPPVCVLIYRGDPVSCFIAVTLFWIASITDWVDGYIARRQNLVTLTGKFLDPLADKLLVMACLLMLLPMGRVPAWIAIVIIGREITISSLRAIAATEGLIISANESGKFKTAFQMTGLIGLLIHYIYEVDYGFATIRINFHILGYGLLLISVFFSMQSAFDYFKGFLKAIEAFHADS
jgi:CDP-diacylglycerol--glycerol-3-phosphate 3-phosphatidyltransferase